MVVLERSIVECFVVRAVVVVVVVIVGGGSRRGSSVRGLGRLVVCGLVRRHFGSFVLSFTVSYNSNLCVWLYVYVCVCTYTPSQGGIPRGHRSKGDDHTTETPNFWFLLAIRTDPSSSYLCLYRPRF